MHQTIRPNLCGHEPDIEINVIKGDRYDRLSYAEVSDTVQTTSYQSIGFFQSYGNRAFRMCQAHAPRTR